MSVAVAVRLTEQTWQVFCHDCRDEIGSMNSIALKAALASTANRGGVLCPECRAACCSRCFIVPRRGRSDDGLCVFCVWETEHGKDDILAVTESCLVNHKSRTNGA